MPQPEPSPPATFTHSEYHSELSRRRKRLWAAYANLLCFGAVGAHKAYLQDLDGTKHYWIPISLMVICPMIVALLSGACHTGSFPDAVFVVVLVISWVCFGAVIVSFIYLLGMLVWDFATLAGQTKRANTKIQSELASRLVGQLPVVESAAESAIVEPLDDVQMESGRNAD